MYLSALEQFEIVSFLAYVSETLPLAITSICVCVSICLFYLFWKTNPKVKVLDVTSSGVTYTDSRSVNGKESKSILIPVTIVDSYTCEKQIKYITEAYINHEWFLQTKTHIMHLSVAFLPDRSVNTTQENHGLRMTSIGNVFVWPRFYTYQKASSFFRKSLNDFMDKQKSKPFQVVTLVITLVSDGG